MGDEKERRNGVEDGGDLVVFIRVVGYTASTVVRVELCTVLRRWAALAYVMYTWHAVDRLMYRTG